MSFRLFVSFNVEPRSISSGRGEIELAVEVRGTHAIFRADATRNDPPRHGPIILALPSLAMLFCGLDWLVDRVALSPQYLERGGPLWLLHEQVIGVERGEDKNAQPRCRQEPVNPATTPTSSNGIAPATRRQRHSRSHLVPAGTRS